MRGWAASEFLTCASKVNMMPNGEHQIIGPDRSQIFDARVKFLSRCDQCENLCWNRLQSESRLLRNRILLSIHLLCRLVRTHTHTHTHAHTTLRPCQSFNLWLFLLFFLHRLLGMLCCTHRRGWRNHVHGVWAHPGVSTFAPCSALIVSGAHAWACIKVVHTCDRFRWAGFTSSGVSAGSAAAKFQSFVYGGKGESGAQVGTE